MSEKKGGDEYFEEMEWRIISEDSSGKYFKFKPTDIKLIIFPNSKIKQMSFSNNHIKDYFSKHMPNTVTLNDCSHF